MTPIKWSVQTDIKGKYFLFRGDALVAKFYDRVHLAEFLRAHQEPTVKPKDRQRVKVFGLQYLHDRFPSGRYKNYTLEQVIVNDPRYVMWCIRNDSFNIQLHENVHRLLISRLQQTTPTAPTFKEDEGLNLSIEETIPEEELTVV